jgi:thiol:disulfide interchange protein DsbA
MHHKIFAEIHNQHRKLDNPDTMGAFLKSQGVDMGKFEATRQSFAVQTRVRNAEEMAKRFEIASVPNMVVAGTWRSGNVQSFEELIGLVDYLIDKAQKEQVATAPAAN